MDDCVPSTENNHDPKQHRTRVDSTSSYVVLRETATLNPGANSSNRNAKQTKQRRKSAKKPEKSNREDVRNVTTVNRGHLHDKSQVERPTNKCSHGLCYHRLLQFLVLFFSVAALGLVILIVLGVLGPDRCSCSQKGELAVLLIIFTKCRVLPSSSRVYKTEPEHLDSLLTVFCFTQTLTRLVSTTGTQVSVERLKRQGIITSSN